MPIIRSPRPERDFTILSNRILNDPQLSWGARGMLVHLLSKPDHWNVNVQALINETRASSRPSGRDAVYKVLDELIKSGYAMRKRYADGTTQTTIFETPNPENPDMAIYPHPENPDQAPKPHPENPDPENPDPENPDVLVKTDKAVKTEMLEKTAVRAGPTSSNKSRRHGEGITLRQYIDGCKAAGKQVLEENDTIYTWNSKITREMILLCWRAFKDRHIEESKCYRDWRAAFRNAVKDDWYHLWFTDRKTGSYVLTTAGQQYYDAYMQEAA